MGRGAGEMAQWLRSHPALAKDLSSVSSTQISRFRIEFTPALLWSPMALLSVAW